MGKANHIPVRVLDKEIKEFRALLSGWAGSPHYQTGGYEWIDKVNGDGDLIVTVTHLTEKYAERIRNRWKDGTTTLDDKHKQDLLKIAHYAGLIYDSLK